MIFVLIGLVLLGVCLVVFVIRRDLSREGLPFGHKSHQGAIRADQTITAPLSKSPCIGYRFEVRHPYDKTVFNKRGQPVHHKSWDILFTGQKIIPFSLDTDQGACPVNVDEADLALDVSGVWKLPKVGEQERDDLLEYIRNWRDDKNPETPAFFNRMESTAAENQFETPENLDDTSLYILEAVYHTGDAVAVTAKTALHQGHLKARAIAKRVS